MSPLHPRLHQELLDKHQSMVDAGELPSLAPLPQYYDNFRSRFGPEVLRNLDGETLLETTHDFGSYDSMVYWLEFKADLEARIAFHDPVYGGQRAQVVLRPVNLLKLEQMVTENRKWACVDYADHFIFGGKSIIFDSCYAVEQDR